MEKYTVRRKRYSLDFFHNLSLTNLLIIINVLVFLLFVVFLVIFPGIEQLVVLTPSLLFEKGYIWTLLTSMFLHASFFHLLANMVSLFFIGNFVEKIIGRKRFFWFYLLSGIIAGLFFAALAYFLGVPVANPETLQFGTSEWWTFSLFGSSLISAVGASGAIFGLLGLLAVVTPRAKVYLIAGPLIAIVLQVVLQNFTFIPAKITGFLNFIIFIYVFASIFMILSFNPKLAKYAVPIETPFWFLPILAIVPLVIIGLFVVLPIGNTAHLGGLIAGLIYGRYLSNKYKNKISKLNRMFG